jgi:hypothetical protein
MPHRNGPSVMGRDGYGNDRERITRARQAAEALFAPNQHLAAQSVGEASSPADLRGPRVLAVASPAPEKVEAPTSPKHLMTPKIPRSQFARVRSWVRYGMTARQVAEVYGVGIGEIESVLRAG